MKKLLFVISLLLMLSGCLGGPLYVTLPTDGNLISSVKTVNITVEDKVQTDYSKSGIALLQNALSEKIGTSKSYIFKRWANEGRRESISTGLNLEMVKQNEDLSILIIVDDFHPTNPAVGLIVGFGSGRGGIHYIAKFIMKGIEVIAVLDDGGRLYDNASRFGFSGTNGYIGSPEGVKIDMAEFSATEVAEFMRSVRIPTDSGQ